MWYSINSITKEVIMHSIQVDGIEYRFFDHSYAVSRCGKVLRKLPPYTPIQRKDGYLSMGKHPLMHRVVATLWVPNPSNAPQVHHINGIKSDNRADNLEWVTPKEHFRERHRIIGGRLVLRQGQATAGGLEQLLAQRAFQPRQLRGHGDRPEVEQRRLRPRLSAVARYRRPVRGRCAR